MAEGKKTKISPESIQPKNDTVGELLRVTRLRKNLSIEEVSVALRIRASQLRVIEENNIEALPGMTYAVGFVRSYANFLGLDGVDVVHRFKAEHSQTPHSKLSFPEPVAESRVPDPMMIGVGAFLAIVVLVVWSIYSSGLNGESAEKIPSAPEAVAAAAPDVMPPPAVESILPRLDETLSADAASTPAAVPAEETPPPTTAAVPAEKIDAAPVAPVAAATEPSEKTAAAVDKAKTDDVINIKRGKGRIMLQSTQDSWVQVTDGQGSILFKKVMKSGEKYYVPDQPGLSLVTANAGGLDVYVDGQKAPSLGKSGEIVRGVVLDPSGIRKKRMKMND